MESKLSQEEIIRYLDEGEIIEQKVFYKLSPEEIQTYFKANISKNSGTLNLANLKSLPNDIKFPEYVLGDLNLANLKSLPDGIKFPERVGGDIYLTDLKSLPNDFFENNLKLRHKIWLNNKRIY